jgi:hypothetical protein
MEAKVSVVNLLLGQSAGTRIDVKLHGLAVLDVFAPVPVTGLPVMLV